MIPLEPAPAAPGVAAGVAGIAPLEPLFCCECWLSFSEGGVKSPAPPGKDRELGAVKALACCAVEGCVVKESIETADCCIEEAILERGDSLE